MKVEVEGLSDILRSDGGESTYEEVIAMGHDSAGVTGRCESISSYHEDRRTDGKASEADLEEQKIRNR